MTDTIWRIWGMRVAAAMFLAAGAAGGFALGRRAGKRTEIAVFLPSEVRLDLSGDPFLGDPNGDLTFVELFDFECPYCRSMRPLVDSLRERFAGGVKYYVKPRPVRSTGTSSLRARALLAAKRQGKYWEMMDALWALTPEDSSKLSVEQVHAQILIAARELDLDSTRFATDLSSKSVRKELANAIAEAERYGINGVPAVLLNGSVVRAERNADAFTAVMMRALSGM